MESNSTIKFPFPYIPEVFTAKEKKTLSHFFTNYDKPVFAIFGLPQEVVGAMFSRYSRTSKSVRRLFLDEFWSDELKLANAGDLKLSKARQRTQNFYKNVFAEYGDDSVIQMGSVHIAFEYVSQIAVKVVEDQRIGAAYIEKSTRYVDFGKKINGHYLYMVPPEIAKSKYSIDYEKWADYAFDSYIASLETTKKYLRKTYPIEKHPFVNTNTGRKFSFKDIKDPKEKEMISNAYERALRAKAYDTIRYFLPISIVANFGAHFSGQSAENALNKMLASDIDEVKIVGQMALAELNKVSPNFLLHVEHRYGEVVRDYKKLTQNKQREISKLFSNKIKKIASSATARLIDYDRDADVKLASQILFTNQTDNKLTKEAIRTWVEKVKSKEIKKTNLKRSPSLEKIILESLPDRSDPKFNRRHKLPRAFEQTSIEVEFFADYGVFKDLQRNRLSSTERQIITADKFTIPKEYKQKGMGKVLKRYKKLTKLTKDLHKNVVNISPEISEYVAIHGTKVRFNIRANLRQWVFFAELRTISGGHPAYRNAMQDAVKEIIKVMPFAKDLFANVDWKRDYGLGRLTAEVRTQEKLAKLADTRN